MDASAGAPLRSAAAQQFSLAMWTTSRRFDGEGRLVEMLLHVASGRVFRPCYACLSVTVVALIHFLECAFPCRVRSKSS